MPGQPIRAVNKLQGSIYSQTVLLSDPEQMPIDLEVFEDLFRRHYAELRQFAYRYLRSESEAEEIVQDVFLAVWTKRRELDTRSTMRAYLYAAVRNRALHSTRHAAVARRFESSERASAIDTSSAVDESESGERASALSAAVSSLPERTRLAIELRWLRQLSQAEIAESMGISIKGVEKLLANGMRLLRQHFE